MTGKMILGIAVAVLLAVVLLGVGFWVGRTTYAYTYGWPGQMMADYNGMMGGPGMMGGFGWATAAPGRILSADEARQAVESYLQRLGDPSLHTDEILIFDNGGYASIRNSQTGSGAFEVLIDPVTKAVSLEYGPAMMWNTEYGMMGGRGYGMMGGMMGGSPGPAVAGTPSVTAEKALQIAQGYLDAYMPGIQAADKVDPFPGYFTIETLKDGEILGMLSVNAYTGQVWVHTWHGSFVEASEVGG